MHVILVVICGHAIFSNYFNKISDRLIFQGVGGICGIAVTVVVKSLILESDGMVYGLDLEHNTYMQCEFHKLLTLPTFPYL